MSAACSFCNQILIESYQHTYYEYAVCLKCYRMMNEKWKVNDFVRISLFKQKGNNKLQKLKRINNQLRQFLTLRHITLQHPFVLQAIDEFFSRMNSITKSHLSDTSTSPSQDIPKQQNPKPKPSLFQSLFQTRIDDNKNIMKIMQIKNRLAQTGNNLMERIKQNEKVEKQVENLQVYKSRLIESSNDVKNKLTRFKQEVKDISAELPSLKQTLKGIGLSKFFKKW